LTLLFKGIGYESLRLDGPIHPQRLKELSITRKLNEHGYMTVTGILPEEEGAQAIQTELEGQPVVLRQLDEEGHSVCRLFHGCITRFTVHCIRSIYTFELEAISQSGQMDMERKRRSFQHTEQTYADLVATVVREYTYGDAIDTIAHATPLGGLVLQYDETDWQFLKRLASRFGSVLVPEITSASPKVFFGMPEGKSYALGEDTFYRIRKTFGQIRSVSGEGEEYSTPARASSNNKPMPGYISYFIDSLHYYALGDHLTLPANAGSTELVVVQAHTVLRDGLLETAYELQHPQQIRFYSDDNEQIIGITLTGRVEEVAADFVRVKLDIDEDYHHKHPKAFVNKELGWFPVSTPYAAEQHTGWYDMPEKGEQVELHIPNSLESNAHVMGSLRQQSSGVSDPDTKIWSHPAGSQLQMDGQELRLSTSGHMTISLQPESGIEINSPGSIGIRGGSVQLNASQTLSLEAGEAIRLKGGQSSMIVDGDTDLHAPTIHEVGTVKAPVIVADLAPVPEPPLMTVEAYQAGQAAAQQAKAKAQAAAAPPKAKITPPAERKKASGLLGLLSKVTAAIPMKTTSKVLMGINSPLARVAGVMMQVNATVPARRSGGEGSGGGSQGIVTAAIQGVYRAAVQEQQARYHMYQAWGKAWTQARHVSLKDLLSHPGQVLSNLGDAAKGIYNAYQEVPPHIRQHWWEKQKAYEAKQVAEEKARQEAAKRAEEATFIGGFNKSMNSLGGLVTDFWGGVTERNDHKLDSTYDFVNWILIGIPGGIKNIADMNESNYNRIQGNTDIYGWANWLTLGIPDMANGALNPKDPFSKEHWANSIGLAGLLVGLKGSPVKGIAGEKIPPAKVSTAPIIDSAAATRSRVESNIADSRAARESSNIRDYFKAEQTLAQERALRDQAADHYSAQTPRTGPEWDEHFRSKYGDESVVWQNDKRNLSKIINSKPAIQVKYGKSDLSSMAKNYRIENKAFDLRNLVVAEVEIDGVRTLKVFESTQRDVIKPNGKVRPKNVHSEMVLIEEKNAAEKNGQTYIVHRVYTEREPCIIDGHNCKRLLAENLPDAEVSYSVEYGDKASRDRGNEQLSKELERIKE